MLFIAAARTALPEALNAIERVRAKIKVLSLYNLKTDLAERQNVADQNPEVVAKLEAWLKTARTDSEHWPIKPSSQKAAGQRR